MDMQNVSNLQIPEGVVRTIHDKDNRLIWGRLAYDTKYAGDTLQNGTPTPDTPIPVQVVTGAQTATISDGVTSMDCPISLTGKNLFDKNNYNLLEAYWGGTSTEMVGFPGGEVSIYIKVKPNTTYTASKTLGTRFRLATTVDLPQANTAITNKIVGDSAASLTITTGSSDQYLSAFVRQGSENTTLTEVLATLQIEEGQTATTYVPYSPIELCKIDDYQDYIYKSGDDWYVHKECGKVVFDGTEAWNGGTSTGSPTYLYAYTVALDSLNLYSARQAFCSHFSIWPNQLATGTSVSYPCLSVVTPTAATYAHIRLMIPLAIAANTNALRTWLGSHNTNLYYVLATSTDTKITDATLIGQLNAVHEWLTRYGYSSNVTGNLPIIIDKTNL